MIVQFIRVSLSPEGAVGMSSEFLSETESALGSSRFGCLKLLCGVNRKNWLGI